MTICTLCVDQERGRYVAFFGEDPIVFAESYTSTDEAVGFLTKRIAGTDYRIERVIDLDVEWEKQKPAGVPV